MWGNILSCQLNGKQHGSAALFGKNGELKSLNRFRHGIQQGWQVQYDAEGRKLRTEAVDGKPTGSWELLDKDARRIITRPARDGKTTGKIVIEGIRSGTRTFEAELEENRPVPGSPVQCPDNGQLRYVRSHGQEILLHCEVDKKAHGPAYTFDLDGEKTAQMEFSHDVPNGNAVWWNRAGQVVRRVTYVDGQLEGPFRSWHDNGGKWVEMEYDKGRCEGAVSVRHANGRPLAAGLCAEDRHVGNWAFWTEDGARKVVVRFPPGAAPAEE